MDITSSDSNINDICYTTLETSQLSHSNTFIINIFLHVTILFTFLNILFKIIIAPLAINAFQYEISSNIHTIINNAIPNPIIIPNKNSQVDVSNPLISKYFITNNDNSNNISYLLKILNNDEIYNNYLNEYSTPNVLIASHNQNILDNSFYISIILIIVTIILITVIKKSCSNCLNITKLLIENTITFCFVGGIEYWFFTTYAKNFVPTLPSLIVTSAIDNIKSYLVITPS